MNLPNIKKYVVICTKLLIIYNYSIEYEYLSVFDRYVSNIADRGEIKYPIVTK